MKKHLLFLSTLLSTLSLAQIPDGYYDSAEGLQGFELKTALHNIIDNHTVYTYDQIKNLFSQTDEDLYYESDGTVLDMYSERPTSADPYNYNFSSNDQCGNYNSESDCYNREHIFPQGFFNQALPMRSDLHHVTPTDGYVNNKRNNFPFGEVGSASWVSLNGSKVGNNTSGGFTGTVFEPIDEFKGDIARILLYFATRYEDVVTSSSWDNPNSDVSNPLDGSNDQVYENWYIDLLLSWNSQDPVSQKEIDRNNAIYNLQGNRNPFIDNPNYANLIWNPNLSVNDLKSTSIKIYPNPVEDILVIESNEEVTSISIYNLSGAKVKSEFKQANKINLNVNDLLAGTYLVTIKTKNANKTIKFIKK